MSLVTTPLTPVTPYQQQDMRDTVLQILAGLRDRRILTPDQFRAAEQEFQAASDLNVGIGFLVMRHLRPILGADSLPERDCCALLEERGVRAPRFLEEIEAGLQDRAPTAVYSLTARPLHAATIGTQPVQSISVAPVRAVASLKLND